MPDAKVVGDGIRVPFLKLGMTYAFAAPLFLSPFGKTPHNGYFARLNPKHI